MSRLASTVDRDAGAGLTQVFKLGDMIRGGNPARANRSVRCTRGQTVQRVKLCYVDETGTDGESPAVVMVGLIADSARLHRTQTEFAEAFDQLGDATVRELRELKAADLYAGNGPWRGVDGSKRASIIGDLCKWVCGRKLDIALAALDRDQFRSNPLDKGLDEWMTAALHIALQVQRAHQGLKKRKGSTFLVFDEHQHHAESLPNLLFEPPEWSDQYYQRGKKQEPLDQVIDTAFYARSHHVGLVQIADLLAFIFRRYAELHDYGLPPRYADEIDLVDGWVSLVAPRLLATSHRWPKRRRDDVSAWYCTAAPPSLRALGYGD